MERPGAGSGNLFPDAPAAASLETSPLAERMRPRSLAEIVGQEEALGPGSPLQGAIAASALPSLILWGPPGSGKTTLARVLHHALDAPYSALSAVLSGVKEVKEILRHAEHLRRAKGVRTILFIDEIHRFNKAQQDALLSAVESGDVILIGATTENPSFEVNSALLSRCRVVVLKPLTPDAVVTILERALADGERGLLSLHPTVEREALSFLAGTSDGDARTALNVLDLVVTTAKADSSGARRVTLADMRRAFARKALLYDKAGEEHFNIISALHKSIRNSDADAGLYWLARMIEGGEDPLYIARRLVRFASEDVGVADPGALSLTIAAQQAVHFIGLPEGALALAEAVVYLAAAPKSNALYRAYGEAVKDSLEGRADPVPLWIRNAPTGLMKSVGYGQGYRYAHDEEEGVAGMECLPDRLVGRRYFRPTTRGAEPELGERLEAARRIRERKAKE